jgi:integrase
MSARFAYSTHVRCPDPQGQECPKLWRADGSWNSRHGSAGWAARIPTSRGTKLVRRFGYGSMAAARQAAQHAGQLLDLAGADATLRAKIGDLIATTRRGQPLPAVEDVRRRLGLGRDPGEPGVSMGEWMASWLAGKRRTRRASAYRSYEMHIRVWLSPVLGDVQLERLNPGHVEAVFDRIDVFNAEVERQRAEGRVLVQIDGDLRAQPRITGPSTKRRIYATLRACLNDAVRKRLITWNPAVAVELDPEAPAPRQRWTPEQAARFITATAGDPMGLMFRIAVLRGARRGELCGFRWAGTDLDRGVLAVERPVLQLGGRLAESTAKTRAGERLVFLDAETAGLLREHRKAQLAARMRAGVSWQDDDLVFCQPDGRPWNPDHVSRRFQRLAAEAGVPVVTLHEGGRHTGVSLMHDAEVRDDIRMREVGHADPGVHARYNHALVEAHLAAAEQVAALVRQAGGSS